VRDSSYARGAVPVMTVMPTRSASIAEGSISSTPSSSRVTSAGISGGMSDASVVSVNGA
jgi:hypothetical protein